MNVCTYDNPDTMCRECWQDGQLLVHYSAELLMMGPNAIRSEYYFFGANVGPWKTGQMIGDIEAMENK